MSLNSRFLVHLYHSTYCLNFICFLSKYGEAFIYHNQIKTFVFEIDLLGLIFDYLVGIQFLRYFNETFFVFHQLSHFQKNNVIKTQFPDAYHLYFYFCVNDVRFLYLNFCENGGCFLYFNFFEIIFH